MIKLKKPKKKFCVLTQVRNEELLFPLWLKYYSTQCNDLYVSRHGGDRKFIAKEQVNYDFTLFEVDKDMDFDHMAMVRNVEPLVRSLLKKYEYVMYVDVDEFVVADPDKYEGLREYMDKVVGDRVICTGREVLQGDGEKAIDLSKPLLEQRKWWWPHSAEFKPAITSVPCTYVAGFHFTEEMRVLIGEGRVSDYVIENADPDLYMIHVNKMCSQLFKERGRGKNRDNPPDFRHGWERRVEIPDKWKVI